MEFHLGRLGTLAARRGERAEAERISTALASFAPPYLREAHALWRARIAAQLGEREQAQHLARRPSRIAGGVAIWSVHRTAAGFPSSRGWIMTKHRIYTTSFASVYPHYVAKAERKGRTKSEVDEIIGWLTGYRQEELEAQLEKRTDFETFFAEAPQLNPSRALVKGVVCGVRVEDIEEPTMREIRYLDKLIDELAKGRAMEKILRKQ
jgi:hypothetical protein